MKNTKWKLVFIGFGLVILITLGWFLSAKKDPKESYKEISVVRADLKKTILTTGLVQPYNRLEIKPPIAGRADEILVEEGKEVKKGEVLAWMSSTERAVLLDAARAKGAETLKYWESLYKPTPLIAPLDGIIIAKNVQSGQTVTQQDPVLVMSDKLIVKAQVDETDVGSVALNQKTELVLDAYPQNRISGHVDHIAYEAKIVNNVTVYEVDVVPEKVPPFMRSGMTANVTFLIAEREDVLVLPIDAIRSEKHQNFVSLSHSKKPVSQEVKLGLSDGKKVEILSGLKEGDLVLVRDRPNGEKRNRSQNNFSPLGGNRQQMRR